MTSLVDGLKKLLSEYSLEPGKAKEPDAASESEPSPRQTGPMYELDGRRVQGMPTTVREEPPYGSNYCGLCREWTDPKQHPLTREQFEKHRAARP
jgi:hypothetical protein